MGIIIKYFLINRFCKDDEIKGRQVRKT